MGSSPHAGGLEIPGNSTRPATSAGPAHVGPQFTVRLSTTQVVALQQSSPGLSGGVHSQFSPVACTVMVATGEQPVTVWASAVRDDTTCTTGVVHATTPAAIAAFFKASRRSIVLD